ncbi:MAG: glycosyltransferase family 9 protein, partial [Chloroflexota bacterium]|nr:glycosyltransferase family 9 protein [Chloroflexota bacterium]
MSARQRTRLTLLRLAGALLTARQRRGPESRREPTQVAPVGGRSGTPRILLVRPDHLGDALLAGPAGHLLAAALPSAEVDWLVGPWAAEVIRRSGQRGRILTCDFPGFTRRPKSTVWGPYRTLLNEAARLRARRYDIAVILRPDHWWGALLAATAGIPRRIGYASPESAPFLTDALPPPGAIHAVTANLALARHAARVLDATSSVPTTAPSFVVADEERAWARDILSGIMSPGEPLIAAHPGSGADVKNWLPERWTAVARQLGARIGAQLVLTGGPAEAALVERIAAGLAPRPPTLAGQTTLGQLAALFERCALVLGGDSGPLHLAAAVGTPTVRVYGPTSRDIFGPWGAPAIHAAIQANLPCQ